MAVPVLPPFASMVKSTLVLRRIWMVLPTVVATQLALPLMLAANPVTMSTTLSCTLPLVGVAYENVVPFSVMMYVEEYAMVSTLTKA